MSWGRERSPNQQGDTYHVEKVMFKSKPLLYTKIDSPYDLCVVRHDQHMCMCVAVVFGVKKRHNNSNEPTYIFRKNEIMISFTYILHTNKFHNKFYNI